MMKRASLAPCSRTSPRRAVVLLVMLSLLALFTVIAVTFVVASGHFRRSAAAFSRAEQYGDPFDVLLQQALMQIVRGSNNPQSVIGPHSLLEDMYGHADAVVGRLENTGELTDRFARDEVRRFWDNGVYTANSRMILKLNAGVSYGWDKKPGRANVDDDNNGIIDDAGEAQAFVGDDVYLGNTPAYPDTLMPATSTAESPGAQIIDNVDNYYAGRVITFLSGNAAGQSCYILRSKIEGLNPGSVGGRVRTVLYVTPPENGSTPFMGDVSKPDSGDRYVINSRAYNGTGFGSTMPGPTSSSGSSNIKKAGDLRLLSYMYGSAADTGIYSMNGKNIPIALTPNPVDAGYRQYLNDMSAIVDADEDYDAPDYQNMLLAHRQGSGRVIAPSLHRPDLVNFFLRGLPPGDNPPKNILGFELPTDRPPRWSDIPPSIRRRIILRPDPTDHYDYTQGGFLDPQQDSDGYKQGDRFDDENGNNVYDPGEKYYPDNDGDPYSPGDRSFANSGFDAIEGPWDVDNDGDGEPDSVWVDIGLPVTTAPDGRLIKPMVAIMVLDMDGRINVNAHGSPKQYTRTSELPAVVPDSSDPGGTWTPLPPSNDLHPHPRKTTEERYIVGAKAIASDQADGDTRRFPMTDPLFTSGYFPEYERSHLFPEIVDGARWATAMEQYPVGPGYDLQAWWSSLSRIYKKTPRIGGIENREMGPWLEPALGQGYSVADINPGILFTALGLGPALGTDTQDKKLIVTNGRFSFYRHLLEGSGDGPMPTPGRYGESHLRRPQGAFYPGIGLVPRPGMTHIPQSVGIYQKSRPAGATDDNVPGIPNTQTVLGNRARMEFGNVGSGDYGTPGDIDSNGATGLDLAGQPTYAQMGVPLETVDDPTEINLHRRYFPQRRLVNTDGDIGATNTGGRGFMTYQDAPFTPSEFERILRQRDPGSAALSNRLNGLLGSDDEERHVLTTEQWDVPCPHVAPTPELAGALRDLGLSLTHPSIGDLLRARFYLTDQARVDQDKSARLATLAMRSYSFSVPLNFATGTPLQQMLNRKQTRLLAPDLGIGVRMDINRPFGNGQDDNGNDVVDEPSEWHLEHVRYVLPDGTPYTLNFDGDLDGNFVAPNNITANNAALVIEQPRQQFAKELYCLMMLLIDENYVLPLPTAFLSGAAAGTSGALEVLPPAVAPTGAGETLPPKYQSNLAGYAEHWLTARRIAQWAINAADFRDRDSIMSAFEFDADPFYDNDGDSYIGSGLFRSDNPWQPTSNGTWDVDGDVNLTNRPRDDTNKPWRGVVWGCEYADLLLTETLAYHDRRTQNHEDDNGVLTNTDGTPVTGTYKLTRARTDGQVILTDTSSMPEKLYDPHWDQPRVPQGTALIELFCTANPNNPMQPRELYFGRQETINSVPVTKNYLHLSRTVSDTAGQTYPVWRLPITQGRVQARQTLTQNDVAARLAQNPATCSLDPADAAFSLLPWVNNGVTDTSQRVTIERVVTFCNQASSVNSTAGLNMTSSTSLVNSPGIDIYSNQANDVAAQPADYIVVGPYRNNVGDSGNNGLDNVTPLGRTTITGMTVNATGSTELQNINLRPQPLISLNSDGFIATGPDGRDQYPTYGGNPTSRMNNAVYNAPNANRPSYRQIRPPVTVACRTTGTLGGDTVGRAVGLNISEPINLERPTVYRLDNNPAITLTLRTTNFVKDGVLNSFDRLYAPDPEDSDGSLVDDIPWDGFMTANVDAAVDTVSVITNTQLPRLDDHTTLRYKNVFLQRLADPLRGWHRYTNPYITIDWMPFDLTVMNAEPWSIEAEHIQHLREPGNIRRRNNGGIPTRPNDPAYTPNGTLASVRVRFGSRQRGAPRYPFKGNFSYCNLWAQPNYLNPIDPNNPNSGDPGGPPLDMDTRPPLTMRVSDKSDVATNNIYGMTPYDYVNPESAANPPTNEFYYKWQDPLIHTLGYINESYHYRRRLTYGRDSVNIGERFNPNHCVADPTIRPDSRTSATDAALGWLMEQDFVSPVDPVHEQQFLKYLGAPWRPFNWLTWNNRPYASAGELMLVPCSSPARLCYEYDMRRTAIPSSSTPDAADKAPWEESRSANHYLPSLAAADVPGYVNRAPYGHLLNFFESSTAASAPSLPEANLATNGRATGYYASNFYRLFEFVHVPSRFSGTRRAHAHDLLNSAQAQYLPLGGVGEAHAWPFVAPFNSYPTFREPGRVNINTMPHYGGDPSSVWRSVTNNFFPTRRYANPLFPNKYQGHARFETHDDDIGSKYSVDRWVGGGGYRRAMAVLSGGPNAHNFDNAAPWNPSMDNRASYHNLVATMRSDGPTYDPRGPNGVVGPNDGDGSLYSSSLARQHDPSRPSLIINPFRSYMEGFTTIPVVPSLISSAASGQSLLAVDATLLRRRDMTWQPFNLVPPASDATGASFLGSRNGRQHIDPAFDPLFALNFPRPYQAGNYDSQGGNRAFSGYTNNMHYRWGSAALNVTGITAPYQTTMLRSGDPYRVGNVNAGTAPMLDNFHSRDTDYRNTDRNPFFRYQLYTKLNNVVTTRSNVYAIWVTLGYFEVERVKINGPAARTMPSQESSGYSGGSDLPDAQRWPSGYRLVREMGADTGEVKRHKAFALFDRTIPVGFIRGENLNVDRAFLTRRILY